MRELALDDLVVCTPHQNVNQNLIIDYTILKSIILLDEFLSNRNIRNISIYISYREAQAVLLKSRTDTRFCWPHLLGIYTKSQLLRFRNNF